MKGVLKFGTKGKLQPRYIRPFEVLDNVGNVAYRLALPPELSTVDNVFHISMIKKYIHDPKHMVNYQSLEVQKDLPYEELPIQILDQKVYKLRNKEVHLIKVKWNNHGVEEATWEREEEVKDKYPTFLAQS